MSTGWLNVPIGSNDNWSGSGGIDDVGPTVVAGAPVDGGVRLVAVADGGEDVAAVEAAAVEAAVDAGIVDAAAVEAADDGVDEVDELLQPTSETRASAATPTWWGRRCRLRPVALEQALIG